MFNATHFNVLISNSTVGCALVAAKLQISVAHVEAGLRSFDRSMPEKINRILAEHLSEILFATEPSGEKNLIQVGISSAHIHFVGNFLIDSLLNNLGKALARQPWERFGLDPHAYGLVALPRPANVDDPKALMGIGLALQEISADLPLVFPMNPRTRSQPPL